VPTANYNACRNSATIETNDAAVLHMLRGLCRHCESGSVKQISWGGTGATDWKRNKNTVTFRFTAEADRDLWRRLFATGRSPTSRR
jgi:hypothetical protein